MVDASGRTGTTSTSIAVDGAVRRYRGGGGIGPVTLNIGPGAIVGLVGSNGSGKTTLLKLLCGLLACQHGSVRVAGAVVRAGHPPVGLGAIIEEPPFYEFASGVDNLRLAAAGRREWADRIEECLRLVSLAEHGRRRVGEYSQGMRQRLGIARALLGDPSLLVLDEPANGLDAGGIVWLRELISTRARAGTTVVFSSHMLAEVCQVADTAFLLRGGEVVAQAGSADLALGTSRLEDLYYGPSH